MAFEDGSKHAQIQPLVQFCYNLLLSIVLVFYTEDAQGQAVVAMCLTWIYTLYVAIFQPFLADNTVVVVSRIFILGGIMEHARPNLIAYACVYFALVHTWRITHTLTAWIKNMSQEEQDELDHEGKEVMNKNDAS